MTTPSLRIFITGNSRSGTTMMSRILGNHPDVFSFQELHFFDEILPPHKVDVEIDKREAIKLFSTLCAIQRNGYFGSRNVKPFIEEASREIGNENNLSPIQVYNNFLHYEAKRNGKSIPSEQTPQNIFSIDEIIKHLPGSKIIVMVRDPREVLLSQKYKWKRRRLSGGEIPFWESFRSRINYHPITISKIWKAVMDHTNKYIDHSDLLIVRYEELVNHPEQTISNVCTHIGIPFLQTLTDIPIVGSSNFADSKISRGIDSSRLQQWNHGGLNSTEIFICQKIAAQQMSRYGYDKVSVKPEMTLLFWYKISMPFRLALALLFNLKRFKNPGKILKRFSN